MDFFLDIGQPGQIVEVKPILAYDLVVLGKALYATPENIKKVQLLPEDAIGKYSSLTAYKVSWNVLFVRDVFEVFYSIPVFEF